MTLKSIKNYQRKLKKHLKHILVRNQYVKLKSLQVRNLELDSKHLNKIGIGLIALTLLGLAVPFTKNWHQNKPLTLKKANAKSDYLYTTSSDQLTINLGKKDNAYPTVELIAGDNNKLSFTLAHLNQEKLQEPTKDGNKITYQDIQPYTDLTYQTIKNGIKEELILKAPVRAHHDAPYQYIFDLTLTGDIHTNSITKGFESNTFYDANGNYLFHIEPPFAIDANGDRTDNVSLQMYRVPNHQRSAASTKDGSELSENESQISHRAILTVDPAWLNHPDRQYPIIIDPTVVHDTDAELENNQMNRVSNQGSTQLETWYQELPADEHTVGLWHMNNAWTDSSGNSNNGTAYNGATFSTSSKLGSHTGSFDGTNDYMLASALTGAPTTDFTIESWIKTSDDSQQWQTIWNFSSYDPALYIYNSAGSNELIYYDGGNDCRTSDLNITDGNWHHVTVTRSSSTCTIYVDGVNVIQGTTDTTSLAGLAFRIGHDTIDADTFDGQIDEVRISNTARTPEEIKASASRRPYSTYTSDVIDLGAPVKSWTDIAWSENGVNTGDGETLFDDTSLVAQWNFNETSGTTADNAAGSCGASCDGTLTNFASTSSQDQATGTGWTTNNKKWGAGALMFDGSNDNISIGDINELDGLSAITVETWLNLKSTATWQDVVSKFNNGETNGWTIELNNGINRFCVVPGSWKCATGSILNTNTWYHIVGTYDGSNVKIYLNGQLEGTTVATGALTANTATVRIGINSNGTSYPTNGTIDSSRIYSRALTASEILSNYNSSNLELQTRVGSSSDPNDGTWEAWKPSTPETQIEAHDELSPIQKISQTSLVAHWRLDETSGTRTDSEGSNNLTDNNTVLYSPGHLKNSADFESSNNEYLSIADNADLSTGDIDFSTSLWVYLEDINTNGLITKGGESGSLREWGLLTNSSGGLRFYISSDGTAESKSITWSKTMTAKTWYHITAWHDASGDEIGLTVNNSTPETLATAGVAPSDRAGDFTIGWSNGLWYSDAKIDEVSFWKRTLTTAERSQLYLDGLDSHTNPTGSIYQEVDATTKIEGSGSEKLTTGAPQVDGNTVALWHLNETNLSGNGVVKDASSNANHLTIKGDPAPIDGMSQKGRDFDGVDDYLCTDTNTDGTCDENTDFMFGDVDFSYGAWFKTSTIDGGIIDTYNSTTQYYRVLVEGSGKVEIRSRDSGSTNLTVASTGAVTDNKWHYVVGVRDTTNNLFKLYLDGAYVNQVSDTRTGNFDSNSPLVVGDLSGTAGYEFTGAIDEPFVTSTALNAEEIAEAYRAGRDHYINKTITSDDLSGDTTLSYYVAADRPGTYLNATIGESAYANYQPDTNTMGLWHMDEGTDNACNAGNDDVCDASGNGNHGDESSSPPIVQGKIGKARNFDGSADYISLPAASGTTHKNYTNGTIEAWVKADTDCSSGYQNIWTVSAGGSYVMALDYCGKRFYIDTTGGGYTVTTTFDYQQWNHIAASWGSSGMKLYVNGILKNTNPYTGISNKTVTTYAIGGWADQSGSTYRYDGTIDEVRISNTARTADEIRQAYEVGQRTHPITIDFAASLSSSDLISDSSDKSFIIDSTTYGAEEKGDNLYPGDQIIIRETVDATEYIAQANVSTISRVSGEVTLGGSWDTGATFPSSGFTANASVFKWQREYMDLSGPLSSHINATTNLTLRLTNGDEGRTIWLDDLNSSSGYATTNTGSTISSSTGYQFMQYRAIGTSSDEAVSANLTNVTLDYITRHPEAHWKFDEGYGTTVYDQSTNALNGTLTSGPTWQPEDMCISGKCLEYDGTDDYTTIADNDALDFAAADDFSIGGWFKHGEISTNADNLITKTIDTYQAYASITIDNTKVSANETNFPIVISDTFDGTAGEPDIRTTGNGGKVQNTDATGGASGSYTVPADLIFTSDSGCSTPLDHEIEKYSASTGEIVAHVEIPSLSSSVDTIIYICYGNTSVTTSQENITGVWDANYLGVWHLGEGGGTAYDSTSNNNNASDNSAATGTTGKIGSGTAFGGGDDYYDLNSALVPASSDFTLESWVRQDVDDWGAMFSQYASAQTGRFTFQLNSSQLIRTDVSGDTKAISTTPVSLGVFHHIVTTRSGNNYQIYRDNNSDGSGSDSTSIYQGVNTILGAEGTTGWNLNGFIDEARISNIARDSNYISTTYNNHASPSTFYFTSAQVEVGMIGYKLYMESDGDITFGIDDDATSFPEDAATTTTANYDDNQWHHFEAVKDGTTSITLYIDGVEVASDTSIAATGTLANSADFNISTNSNGWDGFIDEVRVYSYARSADEIKVDYLDGAVKIGAVNPEEALSNGLVGYWKLDESSGNATDSSGNSNTLTNNGTTTFVTGKYANGSEHNGSTQYLNTATAINNVQTVSFWVNPDSTTNYYTDLNGSAYINSSSGTISATGFTNPTIYVNGEISSTIAADSWQFVTITTGTALNATAFNIGKIASNYFDGTMDEVRLYNRALSSREVRQLYNFAPGPVAHWKFDENTGTTSTYDSSGNSNDLTLTSMTESSWVNGKYGSALTYDGSADYASRTDDADFDFGTANFAVCGWLKTSSTTAYSAILNKYDFTTNTGYLLQLSSDATKLRFSIWDDGIEGAAINSTTTVNDGAWHYFCGTKNGTNTQIYIDGVHENTGTGVTGNVDTDKSLFLGARNNSTYFLNGTIDDVKIYNYARSQRQIMSDMLANAPAEALAKGGASVAHYKFDEGYGSTANDSGTGGNNGTISGPDWTNSGKLGKALDFIATNSDHVTVSSTVSDIGTVSFWVNPDTTTEYYIDLNGSAYIDSSSGTISATGFTSPSIYVNGVVSSTITAGSWQHVVVTTATGISGSAIDIGNIGANYLDGTIDEVKIYSFALTQDEILAEMNFGKAAIFGSTGTASDGTTADFSSAREYCVPGDTSTCNPPVGEWKFDENTGTSTTYDTSNNSNNGTLTSMTESSWVPGKVGSALNFDGNADYIDVGDSSSLDMGTSDFSYEFWMASSNAFTSTKMVISKEDSSSNNDRWGVGINSGKIRPNLDTGGWYSFDSTNTVNDGSWHYVVATYDRSDQLKLFIDGVQDGSVDISAESGVNIDNSYKFLIGALTETGTGNPINFFPGIIDQVRVYNYARTPAQIAWSYNRGKPVGWWRLDENTGTTAYDASGNTNNGTLTNMDTSTDHVAGKRNNALDFDGTNDYVDIGTGPTSVNAISFWINPTTTTEYMVNLTGTSDYIWVNAGTITATGLTSPTTYVNGQVSSTLSAGSWQHVVVTTATAENASNLDIGRTADANYMQGKLDDIRLYNYVPTNKQILDIYNGDALRFGPASGNP